MHDINKLTISIAKKKIIVDYKTLFQVLITLGAVILLLYAVHYALAFRALNHKSILNLDVALYRKEQNFFFLYLLNFLVNIVLLAAFVFWIYQVYSNLHEKHPKSLGYQAPMALYAWFIPIVNFVTPYRILKEIWVYIQKDVVENTIGNLDVPPIKIRSYKMIRNTWIVLWLLVILNCFFVQKYFDALSASDLKSTLWIGCSTLILKAYLLWNMKCYVQRTQAFLSIGQK